MGVERISLTEATTTLRFSLAEPISENVIIPEGTRATSDSSRYFATTVTAVIEAGNTFVDVNAASVGGGTKYNDIPAGAINTIVDMIAFVDSVTNLTATAGGDDEETDDSLRERIRAAPSKQSTAGPVNGYKYWAMSADTSITDVSVKSEQETLERILPVNGLKAYKGGDTLIPNSLIVYLPDGETPAEEGTDYTADYDDDLLTITLDEGGALAAAESIRSNRRHKRQHRQDHPDLRRR